MKPKTSNLITKLKYSCTIFLSIIGSILALITLPLWIVPFALYAVATEYDYPDEG